MLAIPFHAFTSIPAKHLQARRALPLGLRHQHATDQQRASRDAVLPDKRATMRTSHSLPILTLRHLSPSQVHLSLSCKVLQVRKCAFYVSVVYLSTL